MQIRQHFNARLRGAVGSGVRIYKLDRLWGPHPGPGAETVFRLFDFGQDRNGQGQWKIYWSKCGGGGGVPLPRRCRPHPPPLRSQVQCCVDVRWTRSSRCRVLGVGCPVVVPGVPRECRCPRVAVAAAGGPSLDPRGRPLSRHSVSRPASSLSAGGASVKTDAGGFIPFHVAR